MYGIGRIGELDVGETLLLCSSVIIALQSRSVTGRSAMANAGKLPADMDNSAQSREENFTEHQDAESIIEAWGGVECVRTVLKPQSTETVVVRDPLKRRKGAPVNLG